MIKSKSLKRLLSCALVSAVVVTTAVPGVVGGDGFVSAATKPTLSRSSVTINQGGSYNVYVKGTKSTVKWSVGNPARVGVKRLSSVKSKLVAKKPGKTIVRAKVGSKSLPCTVTVREPKLSKTSMTMYEGSSYTLKFGYLISGKKVAWSSSNKSVATVSSSGKVLAKSSGTAYIYGQVFGKKHKCKVVVKRKSTPTVPTNPTTPEDTTSVRLNATTAQMYMGNSLTLKLNNSTGTTTWSSSDTSVATVDKDGLVKALKNGTTTVTATNGGKTYKCVVTVLYRDITDNPPDFTGDDPNAVLAKSVSISGIHPNQIGIGNTVKLSYSILPSNTSNKSVVWESSNPGIATVSPTGVVKFISAGDVEIKCKSADGGAYSVLKLSVPKSVVYAQDVDITGLPDMVKVGRSFTLKGTVYPTNADNKSVIWESLNKDVADVSADGFVSPIKKGTGKIKCTSGDGVVSKTIEFAVVDSDSEETKDLVSIRITNKEQDRPEVGKGYELIPVFTPADVDSKDVIWQSSDGSIAEVNQRGILTFKRLGIVEISCTHVKSGLVARSTYEIRDKAEEIAYAMTVTNVPAMMELYETSKLDVRVTANGMTVTDKNVTFTSSDSSIVFVDGAGNLTARRAGSVVITVSVPEAGIHKDIPIDVATVRPTSVEIVGADVSKMKVGEQMQLTALVNPNYASDKSVHWTSSNTNVARVESETGLVTMVGTGRVTITCICNGDNAVRATLDMSVVTNIVEVNYAMTVDNIPTAMKVGDEADLDVKVTGNKKPIDADIIYVSSNSNVCSIDKTGHIEALDVGTANITVTVPEYNLTQTFIVNVGEITPTNIEVTSEEGAIIEVGHSVQLTAKCTPDDAVNKDITWKSSDDNIATVTKDGLVEFKGVGHVTITCTSVADKDVYTDVEYSVVAETVKSIKIQELTEDIEQYGNYQLTAITDPEGLNNEDYLVWSSSNPDIVDIDRYGEIYVVGSTEKETTVTITCKSAQNGEIKDTLVLTIPKFDEEDPGDDGGDDGEEPEDPWGSGDDGDNGDVDMGWGDE